MCRFQNIITQNSDRIKNNEAVQYTAKCNIVLSFMQKEKNAHAQNPTAMVYS
jgi:hypothetical protein